MSVRDLFLKIAPFLQISPVFPLITLVFFFSSFVSVIFSFLVSWSFFFADIVLLGVDVVGPEGDCVTSLMV